MATALTLLALAFIFIVGAVIVSKVPEPGQPHNLAVKIGRVYFPLVFVGLVLSMIASNLARSLLVSLASRKGSSRSSGRCSVCSVRYTASSQALSLPWPKNRPAALKRLTA